MNSKKPDQHRNTEIDWATKRISDAMILGWIRGVEPLDRYSTWLMVGLAGIGTLMISNLEKLAPHMDMNWFRISLIIIAVSLVLGGVAKYISSRIHMLRTMIEEMGVRVNETIGEIDNFGVRSGPGDQTEHLVHGIRGLTYEDWEMIHRRLLNMTEKMSEGFKKPLRIQMSKSLEDPDHAVKILIEQFLLQRRLMNLQILCAFAFFLGLPFAFR